MNDSHAPEPEVELARLRAELDRVDGRLLDDVRDRLNIIARIAELKQRHAIPVMQPARMQKVHERAADYAHRNGLSTEFLRDLYALLIDEACRVEDLHVDGDSPTQRLADIGEPRN
ncbi:chorismate mutase family protein [Rhodococcus phenolicus]|uniref:chorismate mutase family protein n=1 Tax=Rhodococcus phenolicus TaxID=263849 RepID=UPI000832D744|nr:chorismate mutase family protein [Rhodococcus phenolicus]